MTDLLSTEYLSQSLYFHFISVGIYLQISDHMRFLGKIIFHAIYAKHKNKSHYNTNKIFPKPEKRISILIPARNEVSNIKQVITSVLQIKYKNKEIIVIDDCSSDGTYAAAKEFADKGLIKLLHRNIYPSKAKALNYASQYATGELIAVIDADGKITGESCLSHINEIMSDSKIGAVAGCIIPEKGDNDVKNILTKLQTMEYLIGIEFGKRIQSLLNTIMVISGGLGFFRRDLFQSVGKYNEKTIGEDIDITLKCQKSPKKVIFLPDVKADLKCPNNLKDLIRQRRRWARGQIESLWNHKDLHLFSKNNNLCLRLAIIDIWLNDVVFNFLWIIFWAITGTFFIVEIINSSQPFDLGTFILSNIEGFERFVYQIPQIIQNPSMKIIRQNYFYIVAGLFSLYFISEPIIFMYTIHISKRKEFLKLIYLVPLLVWYRTFLKIINLIGFFDAIRKVKWNW